jgi:hypothetical protein
MASCIKPVETSTKLSTNAAAFKTSKHTSSTLSFKLITTTDAVQTATTLMINSVEKKGTSLVVSVDCEGLSRGRPLSLIQVGKSNVNILLRFTSMVLLIYLI